MTLTFDWFLPTSAVLPDHLVPGEIERAQQVLGSTESTGQDRMHALPPLRAGPAGLR